jgi:hypothetical protein
MPAARFWLDTAQPAMRLALCVPRLERAIGVIYRPQGEQFDDPSGPHPSAGAARAHLALGREPPETFPSGF